MTSPIRIQTYNNLQNATVRYKCIWSIMINSTKKKAPYYPPSLMKLNGQLFVSRDELLV